MSFLGAGSDLNNKDVSYSKEELYNILGIEQDGMQAQADPTKMQAGTLALNPASMLKTLIGVAVGTKMMDATSDVGVEDILSILPPNALQSMIPGMLGANLVKGELPPVGAEPGSDVMGKTTSDLGLPDVTWRSGIHKPPSGDDGDDGGDKKDEKRMLSKISSALKRLLKGEAKAGPDAHFIQNVLARIRQGAAYNEIANISGLTDLLEGSGVTGLQGIGNISEIMSISDAFGVQAPWVTEKERLQDKTVLEYNLQQDAFTPTKVDRTKYNQDLNESYKRMKNKYGK